MIIDRLVHTKLGALGERLIKRKLEKEGFRVTASKTADLHVITPDGVCLDLEIKTARANVRGKYQATCYKKKHTALRGADFVLFLLYPPSSPYPDLFLIPASDVHVNTITISSHPATYAGRWARYRLPLAELTRCLS